MVYESKRSPSLCRLQVPSSFEPFVGWKGFLSVKSPCAVGGLWTWEQGRVEVFEGDGGTLRGRGAQRFLSSVPQIDVSLSLVTCRSLLTIGVLQKLGLFREFI